MKGKHFIQDRSALLLVSVNAFLTLAAIVLIGLKLNSSRGTVNYIISYRSSLGIDGYRQGTMWDIISFVAAAAVIFTFGVMLAYRTHQLRRALALVVLSFTTVLLIFLIIVSNALLILR